LKIHRFSLILQNYGHRPAEESPVQWVFPFNKGGINFAIFSEHAKEMILCLFEKGSASPFIEIFLDPQMHKTGYAWHTEVCNLPKTFDYG